LLEEPTSYEEATKNENWRNAMMSEILSIEKNRTWELTDLPKNHKTVGIKWIFKLKKKIQMEKS